MAGRDNLKNAIRALEHAQSKLGDVSTVSDSLKGVEREIVEFSGRISKFTDVYTQVSVESQSEMPC